MRRAASGGLGWLWLLLAFAGTAGGAFYYYSKRGFAPPAAVAGDSATVPGAGDSLVAGDSVRAPAATPPDTATATAAPAPRDTARTATPAPTPAPRRPAPRPTTPPPATAAASDSGSLRLTGLPRGSTVLIDERPVVEPTTRLAAGPHVLAISAPRFNFFTDTVMIRAGDNIDLTPELQPLGAPAAPQTPASSPPPASEPAGAPSADGAGRCTPGPGYNSDGSCFDERPKPVNPPFVPLPEGVTGSPRPSLMWVKVSADGRTLDLRRLRASNDSTFDRAASDFVWTVTWHPALKDGAPVEAWTQMLFPPQPQ
jgi:outer membrane biosynthesis protein TonB